MLQLGSVERASVKILTSPGDLAVVFSGGHQWYKIDPDTSDPSRPRPFPVYFRLGRSASGETVISGMLIGSLDGTDEILARTIRHIPIGAALEEASATLASWTSSDDDFERELGKELLSMSSQIRGERSRPGPKAWQTQGFLTEIANLYMEASQKAPRGKYRFMKERIDSDPRIRELYPDAVEVAEGTIRSWVKKIRDNHPALLRRRNP